MPPPCPSCPLPCKTPILQAFLSSVTTESSPTTRLTTCSPLVYSSDSAANSLVFSQKIKGCQHPGQMSCVFGSSAILLLQGPPQFHPTLFCVGSDSLSLMHLLYRFPLTTSSFKTAFRIVFFFSFFNSFLKAYFP